MTTNPQDIKGPIALTGRLEALPGKADELAQWLANMKARADSDLEPGAVQYHVARFGDSFALYEEYVDFEAFSAHSNSALLQEFYRIKDTLMKPGGAAFYPAKSLPEPAIQV